MHLRPPMANQISHKVGRGTGESMALSLQQGRANVGLVHLNLSPTKNNQQNLVQYASSIIISYRLYCYIKFGSQQRNYKRT